MFTIFMKFNGRYLEMDTVDSMEEALRRVKVYFNRNPRRYLIRDTQKRYYNIMGVCLGENPG
jgi:hypothetical protein